MNPIHLLYSICLIGLFSLSACSKTDYRLDADRDAYNVIQERNTDPRWAVEKISIDVDQRSRFFDKYDPDNSPMPQDDPTSQAYMKVVDGISGWDHWEENGIRGEIENPVWRDLLKDYVEVNEDGAVKLDINSALKLAYLHSPNHQRQLETLYLSALDVTRERFRLDSQFFGGFDADYVRDNDGSQASAGRDSEFNPTLEATKMLAQGGDLLARLANSFVYEISGSDPNFSPSSFSATIINLAFVQPLLRGAGKDVALEQLTRTERNLLNNLRAYSQFRQGFYTRIAIGDSGVLGTRRSGSGIQVSSYQGEGFVGGYFGLLQQLQRIRNTEENLDLQTRTLAQLEANLEAGLIDLVQVDQFRQNIEFDRANLLEDQDGLEQSLDNFKTYTLGLPPDLEIQLQDDLIEPFQFVAQEAAEAQDTIADLQARIGAYQAQAGQAALNVIVYETAELYQLVQSHIQGIEQDFKVMDQTVEERRARMSEKDHSTLLQERGQLQDRLDLILQQLKASGQKLEQLQSQLTEQNIENETVVRGVVVLLGEFLRMVQGSILVQARARLEAITLEPIEMNSKKAYELALENRLDLMNARSALVDSWRLIQFNADALQSRLNLTASGTLSTSDDSAVDFKSPNYSILFGLEFDTPLIRLIERNDYRESLINYQQARRSFISSTDALHLGIRSLLRDLKQLERSLEIQRRAVVIAIRRVDLTRAELYAPVRPPQPGQRPTQFGPTAAINLLSALSSLRDTQNRFLSVWLSYRAQRMRLFREIGLMKIDAQGDWIDPALPFESLSNPIVLNVPPQIPQALMQTVKKLHEEQAQKKGGG